jgi:hypothetical protein
MDHLALILLQGTDNLAPWQKAMHDFLTGPSMVTIGTWIAAGLTLFMFSFIYKDNPLFRFGEHLYLGISAGYGSTIYWFTYIKPKLIYPLIPTLDPKFGTSEGTIPNYWVIIPAILGAFILMRLVPGKGWMSRITFAFVIGGGTGIGLPLVVLNLFLPQFSDTISKIPWVDFTAAREMVTQVGLMGSLWTYAEAFVPLLNALVLFFGALTVLVYFFFSVEHRGFAGGVSRVGIYFLMISFGASFGYTIMARVSLLIGRIQFLMFDWIGNEIVGKLAMLMHPR